MILAHHIILTGYGHWLPNDPRGSMSDAVHASAVANLGERHFGRKAVEPAREELRAFHREAREKLCYPVLWWDDRARRALSLAFGAVAERHGLTCYGAAILANHVHLLIRRHRVSAEQMERDLKEAGRAALADCGLAPAVHPVFSADSCRIFKSSAWEIRACIDYIRDNYTKHQIEPARCEWVKRYDDWSPPSWVLKRQTQASMKAPNASETQMRGSATAPNASGRAGDGTSGGLFPDRVRGVREPGAGAAPEVVFSDSSAPGAAITVAFDSPLYREFDYALPPELIGKVQPGQRVEVPFGKGNRPQTGFCVGLPSQWRMPRLKQIFRLIDEQPLIDAGLFDLACWISEYYVAPVGRTLAAMVPSAVKRQVGMEQRTMVHLSIPPESIDAAIQGLRKSAKREAVLAAVNDVGAFAPQCAIEIADLAKRAGCTRSPIAQLIEKGILASFTQDVLPGQAPPPAVLAEPNFQLNDLQEAALAKLGPKVDNPSFSVTLLHGVTGSGKTEIYLRLIRRALAAGRQVLVLIPEIALTTQAVDRYRKRLGSVAVIHSGLNDTQRHLAWSRIARGDYQVVLGTLSAVFAPCPRLGLIVVDEEQESSFKHLKSPRYSARDVAIKRAQLLGIPAVLGSATPSLESWHNAQHLQRYEYIELPRRVSDVPLPKVRVVDMHEESRARRGVHLLSRLLEQQIQFVLDNHQQAVLLLNRRGYASYLFCQSCQFVMSCRRCNVHLTYHKALDVGLCHQCGRREAVPANCPSCGHKLIRFGLGTQRIEEELKTKFPTLRYARVDSDTMQHAHDYERVLGQFERGELDLMLGTQMIAKGLDFPNVRLVGVASADTTLAVPDFRSAERTFQLVSQVAGRAGRTGAGGEGRVVIQTLHPALPAIQFAVKHDYRGFAEGELPARQSLGYPPFGRLALFVLRHRDRNKLALAADETAAALRRVRESAGVPGRVIGPVVAPIERIRDQFRLHILLQSPRADLMQRWLAEARRQGALDVGVDWLVDVDPLALM